MADRAPFCSLCEPDFAVHLSRVVILFLFEWSIFITSIGNIVSLLSVIVWSASPVLVLNCEGVPPLYLAGFAGMILGLWQAVKEVRAGGFAELRAPAGACLFEAFGVSGYRMLVYPAIMMIDPVEASNTYYVWIFGAIVCGTLMAGRPLGARHWIAALCFAAVLSTVAAGGIATGHVMALAGGLIWAWYLAKSAYVEGSGAKASAIGNTAAGALIVVLAFIAGNRWEMTGGDWLSLFVMLVVSNAGLVLWEWGMRHGEPRVAKVSVLFFPVATAMWIWIVWGIDPDPLDIAGMAAVTAAGAVASPHVFRGARTAPQQH